MWSDWRESTLCKDLLFHALIMSSVMNEWGEIKQEYQDVWEIAIKLLVAAGVDAWSHCIPLVL